MYGLPPKRRPLRYPAVLSERRLEGLHRAQCEACGAPASVTVRIDQAALSEPLEVRLCLEHVWLPRRHRFDELNKLINSQTEQP